MNRDERAPQPIAQPKLNASGRLLKLVLTAGGESDLSRLARGLRVPVRHLRECHDGERTLEPELQMLLAALVAELMPEHAAVARRVFAQGQSALRLREGIIESHSTDARPHWR